jgi:hypothetical protein
MRLVHRHSDTLFYPTSALLRSSLSDLFDVKEIGFPETPVGDPIPRHVSHCVPRAVAIVVLDGTPSSRNWRLIQSFRHAGAKEISLPKFIWSIASAQYHHTRLQKAIRDEFQRREFNDLLTFLDNQNMLDELIDVFLKAINSNDSVVILETGAKVELATRIRARVGQQFVVWDLQKLD